MPSERSIKPLAVEEEELCEEGLCDGGHYPSLGWVTISKDIWVRYVGYHDDTIGGKTGTCDIDEYKDILGKPCFNCSAILYTEASYYQKML